MPESINDFLKRKHTEAREQPVDWEARRREWLNALNGFYETIRAWLAPSISGGAVSVSEERAILKEEYLGQYDAPSLVLTIAKAHVRFRPVGTLLVGAKGRIDMLCGRHVAMIILDGKGWHFAKRHGDAPPTLTDFNEDTFSLALREMLEE